ncbi:MAG: putative NTPase family [Gammaproteobacteria bacterium]|nr:putative NTPase family [Gammaproteobacteria bacterium]
MLPFGELTWENFERLCYRLAGRSERVEYVARYGRSGQAQQGIDLFVRLAGGKYEVWQAKRYKLIDASDVRLIIEKFRSGAWKDKSERLVLAVQASIDDTKVQDEIEAQANLLNTNGITFLPRGGDELSETLRQLPELVDDFFGRGWVEAFIGPEAAKALGARLDGAEFTRVRTQLRRFYDAHFHLLDVGIALPLDGDDSGRNAPPSLLRRFAVPDVLIRETAADEQRGRQLQNGQSRLNASEASAGSGGEGRPTRMRRREYVRRTSLGTWLGDGLYLAVVGEAGSGKSTLLRCIALDILTERGVFLQISRRWGDLLPIHVSFSRWSRLSARLGRAAGLKEVVVEALQPALTADLLSLLDRAIDERRVLLLLDGLDEWSDEQAARTTLQHILAFVVTHSLPTIATARPRGLDKIGTIPPGWRTAELAPLSIDQQRTLAEVWFLRGLGRESPPEQPSERVPIEERLDRFFADVARDRRLSSLAGNPLLLVGLIALSLRQIALPRNRMQAVQSLVAILVETHPEHRATAAGDIKPRFVHITAAEDRRAALGRLAFVARSASGGGTYDISEARKTIRDYLADPNTLAYTNDRAQSAAAEMLAVNAETVGLLAERAPGEIGFAHAVFEEYLAAEYIQGWQFTEITDFVRDRSGDSLWRNVISNLVSLVGRTTEVESLVAAVETARADETNREGAISRDILLADIAFSSSRKQPATAQRLVNRAFNIIERGDWMLARREVLKAALTSIGETETTTPVDSRVVSWAPRRQQYLSELFEALGAWKPTPQLRNVLIGGIHDEERANQRKAASALAKLYARDAELQQTLRDTLRSTLELSVAAAALEALSAGWPETPGLAELHDSARISLDPTLRLVGISGRATSARADQTDRDSLVELLTEFPEIDFWDRPAARVLLSQHWPDDPSLIDVALNAAQRGIAGHGQFERESAMHYLLHCSPTNPKVVSWIRRELKERYPFSVAHDDLWDCIAPFALEHSDIRLDVIRCIRSEFGRHHLHALQGLIVEVGGDELRDLLIEISRDEPVWGGYWAVRPLLEGWGRSDPVVASFLDEVKSWDDEKLQDLAAILPRLLTDFATCRTRLLSLVHSSKRPRFDLIARGLAAAGCTADDTEVVDTLLAAVGRGAPAFDPTTTLLTSFSGNPRVKEFALETLRGRDPPLGNLARAYEDDAEIRKQILGYANPLPVTLRGEIAEVAFADVNSQQTYQRMLEGYDIEVDGDLKIAGSIYYHRYVTRTPLGASDDHVRKLEKALHAVGPDLQERRTAAFAGMLLLGRVNEFAHMIDYGDKAMHIPTGTGYGSESDTLMALICERWEQVQQAFSINLTSRFGDSGAEDGYLWDCLAPHINESTVARRDFLAYCNQTNGTLGLASVIALAREQPSSKLLLDHCWRAFERDVTGRHASPWAVQRTRFEVAYILRDQFRESADVKERLRQSGMRGRTEVVATVLVDPRDSLLDQIPYGPKQIALEFSDWVTALHLASARSGADEFVEIALAMINRSSHGIWNFQEITNRAVVERLQRDPDAMRRLKDRLIADPTEHEISSLPRYLMAAGALDSQISEQCRALLQAEARHLLPRAAYDAVEDSTRAVSRSLLEVLAPSFSP